MHDASLDEIWRQGYDEAVNGTRTISDCPHKNMDLKRSWTLGYIEGLKFRWSNSKK